ncbi:tail fiber assembly protein [Escherichia coli]|nr:tail fiber assembly protein [Escherichia coli]
MQHLKNIVRGNPKTKEQYQLTKKFGVIWLYAEDGQNWYEAQKKFQPDTLKIAYDASGIIRYIEKDVSAINPEGMSVVELPDTTANHRADIFGDWVFQDDRVMKRPRTDEELRQLAEIQKQILLRQAREETQCWQTQLALGIITDSDRQRLTDWMLYMQQVEATDTSVLPVTFPEPPE